MSTRDAEKLAGFALAALLCDDRDLTLVADAVSSQLASDVRSLLARSQGEALGPASGPSVARAERVRRLLFAVVPRLSPDVEGLPPRLLGLIAKHLPRELRGQVRALPERTSFAVTGELVARLVRIARVSQRERGHG